MGSSLSFKLMNTSVLGTSKRLTDAVGVGGHRADKGSPPPP